MEKQQKQRLVATNAAVLAIGALASFALPMITDSIVDGEGKFLRMLAHVFPLICGIGFSCHLMSGAIPDDSFQRKSHS